MFCYNFQVKLTNSPNSTALGEALEVVMETEEWPDIEAIFCFPRKDFGGDSVLSCWVPCEKASKFAEESAGEKNHGIWPYRFVTETHSARPKCIKLASVWQGNQGKFGVFSMQLK